MTLRSFTFDELQHARETAEQAGRDVIAVLSEQTGVTGTSLIAALNTTFKKRVASVADLKLLQPAFDLVTLAEGIARDCHLFRDLQNQLICVVSNPFDQAPLAWLETKTEEYFSVWLILEADLRAWQTLYSNGLRAIETALVPDDAPPSSDNAIEKLSLKGIAEDASPVVRLVNSTIFDALRADASDIHLETTRAGMTIRYRLDGVLHAMGSTQTTDIAQQVISRIKVMSALDISERRVPQDGRFKVSLNDKEIDLRVSIMPSIFGEDAVLRILDKKSISNQVGGLSLTSLGFDAPTATTLRRLATEPYGMFLVTGPTGSGKTTTLYAAISEINDGSEKIVTIEDPVEYQLNGVLQIPVNEKKGLSFARGLRSILRHDPDKIMVGEIRDAETANIAIQSALTGHLVFTTVHANNVFDVLGRFINMGVDPYSFVSALNGILAQRLVRLNCPQCAEPDSPPEALLTASRFSWDETDPPAFRAGRGCAHCHGSGFKGRTTIAEVLTVTDELRELVIARAPIRQIKEVARVNGTKFLRESAMELVRRGETTLAEINRVTFVS